MICWKRFLHLEAPRIDYGSGCGHCRLKNKYLKAVNIVSSDVKTSVACKFCETRFDVHRCGHLPMWTHTFNSTRIRQFILHIFRLTALHWKQRCLMVCRPRLLLKSRYAWFDYAEFMIRQPHYEVLIQFVQHSNSQCRCRNA